MQALLNMYSLFHPDTFFFPHLLFGTNTRTYTHRHALMRTNTYSRTHTNTLTPTVFVFLPAGPLRPSQKRRQHLALLPSSAANLSKEKVLFAHGPNWMPANIQKCMLTHHSFNDLHRLGLHLMFSCLVCFPFFSSTLPFYDQKAWAWRTFVKMTDPWLPSFWKW